MLLYLSIYLSITHSLFIYIPFDCLETVKTFSVYRELQCKKSATMPALRRVPAEVLRAAAALLPTCEAAWRAAEAWPTRGPPCSKLTSPDNRSRPLNGEGGRDCFFPYNSL